MRSSRTARYSVEMGRSQQRFATPRWRTLAALAVAGLALAALGVSQRASTSPLRSVPSAAPRPVFAHAFVPGRVSSYSIDYRSEGTLDGRLETAPVGESTPQRGGVLEVSSTFLGTLVLAVAESHTDGSAKVLGTLALDEARLTVSGRPAPTPVAAFASLARGFVVEYGPDGAIRGLAMETGTHPVAERLASQVLSFMQLVTATERPSAQSWEHDERDATGPTHARYAVLADPPSHEGNRLIEKVVTRTARPRSNGALGRLLEVGRSGSEATLAFEVSPARGIVVEAAGALATEQILGTRRVGADDSTVLVLLRGDVQEDPATIARRVAERMPVLAPARPLDPEPLRAAERRKRNEDLLATLDVPAIVADAIAHPPAAHSRDAATYADILAAIVDASPDGRAHLEKLLTDPRTGESGFLPIARAFGEDGSPEAQAVLARVVAARPSRDPAREAAMFSLSHAEHPTDGTVSLLEGIARKAEDPWAYAAWLCLGRVAGQLAAVDPARGGPLVHRLVVRAREATGDGERRRAIEALGNAGLPLLEAELDTYRRASAVEVRRAAVGAYRLVPTTSARDAMLAALATDPDVTVRAEALDGVVLRPPDDAIANAVADRLEHDAEESVKKPAASRLMSLCPRNRAACGHIARLQKSGDEWTRNELSAFTVPR